VEKVFKCLTKTFSIVIIAIDESKYLYKFIIDELMGSLMSHESRLNVEEEDLEHTLKT